MEDWEPLCEKLERYVRRKFWTRPNIAQMAGEIVQETVAALLAGGELPREKQNFGYLSAACLHTAYRLFRQWDEAAGRCVPADGLLEFIGESAVVEELIRSENTREILDSLDVLREVERTIILQRYYGELNFREISAANGINLNTVLSHHRRALEKLRRRLSATLGGGRGIITGKEGRNKMTRQTTQDKEGARRLLALNAERIWRLGLDVALQSARLSSAGLAVVADETRNIAGKLYEALAQGHTGGEALGEVLLELRALAVNGMIECCRITDALCSECETKPVYVLLDEIGNVSAELGEALGAAQPPRTRPELVRYDTVLDWGAVHSVTLLEYTVGGETFYENVRFAQELLRCRGKQKDFVRCRGKDYPLADAASFGFEQPSGGSPMALILNRDWDSPGSAVAVPLDGLPAVFRSRIGVSVAPRGPRAGLARAAWDCGEEQMLFADWFRP